MTPNPIEFKKGTSANYVSTKWWEENEIRNKASLDIKLK